MVLTPVSPTTERKAAGLCHGFFSYMITLLVAAVEGTTIAPFDLLLYRRLKQPPRTGRYRSQFVGLRNCEPPAVASAAVSHLPWSLHVSDSFGMVSDIFEGTEDQYGTYQRQSG